MGKPGNKYGNSRYFRRIEILLLLAVFTLGPGVATAMSSVLCLGKDGHRAIESASTCAYCAVRFNPSAQQESMISAGDRSPAGSCGPCRDLSLSSANVISGVSVPAFSGLGGDHVAPPVLECVAGHRFGIRSVSYGFVLKDLPAPAAIRAHPIVLLI